MREEFLDEVMKTGEVLFSINNHKSIWGHYDKSFRAILRLGSHAQLPAIKKQIGYMVELVEKSTKKDSSNSMLIPRLVEDRSIIKIHTHVNQAHSYRQQNKAKLYSYNYYLNYWQLMYCY